MGVVLYLVERSLGGGPNDVETGTRGLRLVDDGAWLVVAVVHEINEVVHDAEPRLGGEKALGDELAEHF